MLAGGGGEPGAEGVIVEAVRWLEGAAGKGEAEALDEPVAALGRALVELGEATRGVEDALARMDFDPRALEAAEERLFALRNERKIAESLKIAFEAPCRPNMLRYARR